MNPVVIPGVAGIYDPRDPPTQRTREQLVEAMGAHHTNSFVDGPLAIAWAGPVAAHLADEERFVLVQGRLWRSAPVDGRDPVMFLRAARGEFIAIIYDRRARTLVIARDHVGARSVWYHGETTLRFASDGRQLLRFLPTQPAPNKVALAHWLGMSGLPGSHFYYDGIRGVLPAEILEMAPGRALRTSKYWEPVYKRPQRRTVAEAADGLRDVLSRSIAARADGPSTGVLLSGGLDSSSVAALASLLRAEQRPSRAYSAVFPDHPTVDEDALIGELGVAFDLDVTRAVVRSGSVLSGAIRYVREWKVPPISPNLFFWLPLLEQARADGTTSLLDGEGGDEILGYNPYLMSDYLRHGRVLGAFRLLNRIPGTTPQIKWKQKWPFFREYGLKGAAPARLHEAVRRHRGGATYLPKWVGPELADVFLASNEPGAWRRRAGPRWWAFFVDIFTEGMAATMTHDHVRHRGVMCGIEPRHPLFDVDVIEYTLGLPPELGFEPRWTRPVIREAVAGVLPDNVRLRFTKSNFDAIFHACLAGPDLPVVRELLDPERALVAPFIEPSALRTHLAVVPNRYERPRWASELWRVVTAELWLQEQAGTLEPLVDRLQLHPADVDVVSAESTG